MVASENNHSKCGNFGTFISPKSSFEPLALKRHAKTFWQLKAKKHDFPKLEPGHGARHIQHLTSAFCICVTT
jgi:hypothetical protein